MAPGGPAARGRRHPPLRLVHVYPIKWARRGSPSPRGTSKSNSASSSPCPTSNLPPSCQSNHATAEDGFVPRRTSAVLFVAPKDVSTPLEPVVMEGETRQFISGIKVGQLRGDIARKWRHREGTLNAEDKLLEEREIRVEQLVTQDDVVQSTIQVQGS